MRRLSAQVGAELWLVREPGDGAASPPLVVRRCVGEAERAEIEGAAEAIDRIVQSGDPRLARHVDAWRDLGTDRDGALCVVGAYLPGGSLERLLRHRDALAIGEVVTILAPLTGVVEALHHTRVGHGGLTLAQVRFDGGGAPVVLAPRRPACAPPDAPEVALATVDAVQRDRAAILEIAAAMAPRVRGRGAGEFTALLESVRERPAPLQAQVLAEGLFALAPGEPVRFPERRPESARGRVDTVMQPAGSADAGEQPRGAGARVRAVGRDGAAGASLSQGATGLGSSGPGLPGFGSSGSRGPGAPEPGATAPAGSALGGRRLDGLGLALPPFIEAAMRRVLTGGASRAVRESLASRWHAATPASRRAAVAVAAGAVAVAVVASVLPPTDLPEEEHPPASVTVAPDPAGGSRTEESSAGVGGGPVGASPADGTASAASDDDAAAAVTGDDPERAAGVLLRSRERCVRELSIACLRAVVQPTSPAAAAGRSLIERLASGGRAADATELPPLDGWHAVLVQRLGDGALLTWEPRADAPTSPKTPPASLLLMQGEAGWRLRDVRRGDDRAD